jgi:hypothetical protein
VFALEVNYGALHLRKPIYLNYPTKYYGALHLLKITYLKCATNIAVRCTLGKQLFKLSYKILRCAAPFENGLFKMCYKYFGALQILRCAAPFENGLF